MSATWSCPNCNADVLGSVCPICYPYSTPYNEGYEAGQEAAEARIKELEEENQRLREAVKPDVPAYEARIAKLEAENQRLRAVAEAAAVEYAQGPLGNFSEWEVLGDALRAAGYLK